MWFGLKPTFIRENEEELPLLLKEITILKLSNPIITLKMDFFFLIKISSFIFLIIKEYSIKN